MEGWPPSGSHTGNYNTTDDLWGLPFFEGVSLALALFVLRDITADNCHVCR